MTKYICIDDLATLKPISKVYAYPQEINGETFYYEIRELTIAESQKVKTLALNQTIQDIKGKKDVDFSKSKEEIIQLLETAHANIFKENMDVELIIATSYNPDNGKRIFGDRESLIKTHQHSHVLPMLVLNYADFVESTSPFIMQQKTLIDIKDFVKGLEDSVSPGFLELQLQEWNKRDLTSLSVHLISTLKQMQNNV